nr:PQQ-dependent sugar dehydrogenase [Natronosalvus vescus]
METVVDDLSHPWGLEFVPDTEYALITIRGGELLLADREGGSTEQIEGIPDVYASGQGGLLDVTLHPEYPEESWMYLTYSVANDEGESATAVGRGQFDPDADTLSLESFEEIHVAEPFVDSTGHFGSRVVFGPDEMIYVTTGDRQSKDFGPEHVSQDTTNELGATLRLEPDGSIPDDNPFVDDDEFTDAIFTYGHRNVQGMTVHPETDEIWQSEHGEEDGDELNVLEEGGNFGWPIAHTGCEYGTDEPVGEDPHERDDVIDPVYYWECTSGGFPPAGMTFYDGEAFPEWGGDLFVGNLAGQYLGRFTVDGTDVDEVGSLLGGEGWRIRDVAVAPDTGYLYVLVDDDNGPLVRVIPD